MKDHRKNELIRVTRYRAEKSLGQLYEDIELLEKLIREYPRTYVRRSR